MSSVAFVGIDPPQNISNKKIDDFGQITIKFQTESCEIENLKKMLAQKEKEILKLKLELKRSEERMKDREAKGDFILKKFVFLKWKKTIYLKKLGKNFIFLNEHSKIYQQYEGNPKNIIEIH